MADLPDISLFTESDTRALSVCVLRALCDAYGAPKKCTHSKSRSTDCVVWLNENVIGKHLSWPDIHQAFLKKQRAAFDEFFAKQLEVHTHFKVQQQRIREEAGMLASIAALVDSAVEVSPPPAERFVSSAEKVLEEVFLRELEESAAAVADQALPRSASMIVQDFLAGFNARKSAPGAALQEDAVISGCVLLSFFLPVCCTDRFTDCTI
jgi:hypothetical protein